jgi:hypothetical protein
MAIFLRGIFDSVARKGLEAHLSGVSVQGAAMPKGIRRWLLLSNGPFSASFDRLVGHSGPKSVSDQLSGSP